MTQFGGTSSIISPTIHGPLNSTNNDIKSDTNAEGNRREKERLTGLKEEKITGFWGQREAR